MRGDSLRFHDCPWEPTPQAMTLWYTLNGGQYRRRLQAYQALDHSGWVLEGEIEDSSGRALIVLTPGRQRFGAAHVSWALGVLQASNNGLRRWVHLVLRAFGVLEPLPQRACAPELIFEGRRFCVNTGQLLPPLSHQLPEGPRPLASTPRLQLVKGPRPLNLPGAGPKFQTPNLKIAD